MHEPTSELEQLYATVPAGLLLVDTDYRVIRLNEAAAHISGKSTEKQIGHTVREIIPNLADQVEAIYAQVLSSGEPAFGLEINGVVSSEPGINRHWLGSYCPLKTADGDVWAVSILFHDITERKRAEEELGKSEAHYRNLTESLEQLVYCADPETLAALFVNNAVERYYGITVEEWLNDPTLWESTIHPDDRERVFAEFTEMQEEVRSGVVAYRIAGKGQKLRWVEDHISWERDQQDNVVSMNGVMYDITERKQAEQALQRSEQRFRILYDDIPIMLFVVDESGNVLSGNKFGIDQLGYSSHQLEGKRMIDLFYEEDRSLAQDCLKRCFAEPDKVHNWELRKIRQDGTRFYAYETARVVDDVDGKPTALLVCEDVTEKRRLSEKLSHQATHDALTNLVNRREFERRLERVLDTIDQDQSNHALCFMDLDQFKVVNDSCGHVAGDELLRQLSLVLQNGVRKRDTLARLGGDEFGILMENCSLDQVQRLVDSLRQLIEEFQFHWEGQVFRVGVSIGLVAVSSENSDLKELLKQADAACYMAKDQGCNRVHVYHSNDAELAKREGELKWVARLHHALEENQFCLYAQPIVSIGKQTEGHAHCEILVRMRNEDGSLIPPAKFLPAAERYNLINRIDRWVVSSAFQTVKDYAVLDNRNTFFSINLSGRSLVEPGMLKFIVDQFRVHEIAPGQVCFEITETAAIANLGMATSFMSSLTELGCKFALDDFGSGLSSFGYLKNLKVDYLKIDGMFVKDMVSDKIAHAMVKSINEIGHVMGIQTVAEFVENHEIKGMLREMGVDYVQGYGVGKPQPLEELLGNITSKGG